MWSHNEGFDCFPSQCSFSFILSLNVSIDKNTVPPISRAANTNIPVSFAFVLELDSLWAPAPAVWPLSYITILRHGPVAGPSAQTINTVTPPPGSPPLCTCSTHIPVVVLTWVRRQWDSLLCSFVSTAQYVNLVVELDLKGAVLRLYNYFLESTHKTAHWKKCRNVYSLQLRTTRFPKQSVPLKFTH